MPFLGCCATYGRMTAWRPERHPSLRVRVVSNLGGFINYFTSCCGVCVILGAVVAEGGGYRLRSAAGVRFDIGDTSKRRAETSDEWDEERRVIDRSRPILLSGATGAEARPMLSSITFRSRTCIICAPTRRLPDDGRGGESQAALLEGFVPTTPPDLSAPRWPPSPSPCGASDERSTSRSSHSQDRPRRAAGCYGRHRHGRRQAWLTAWS